MSSAICLVNGLSTETVSVDVSTGASITIQLADLTGVSSWDISCIETDDKHDANTITNLLVKNDLTKTATFTMPSDGYGMTFIFQSVVNQGIDVNGLEVQAYTYTFAICVRYGGIRLLAKNETVETDRNFGWIVDWNATIRAVGGSSSPSLSVVLTTGNQTLGNNISVTTGDHITIADAPVNPTDAANKAYVDGGISLAGDVSGSVGSNTVNKIKNITLSIPSHGAAQDGYVLTYINGNTDFELKPAGTITLAGDVTGGTSANTVVKINGSPITTIGSANTLIGTHDGFNITYFQLTNSQVASGAAITVSKLANGSALSVLGVSANSTGAHADIAGANNQVLRISGSVLGFGAVDLGTAQVTASADISANIHKITNVVNPTNPQDVATKHYVDGYGYTTLAIAGDVTGTLAAATVVKLQNRALSSSAPTDGYALIWDAGSSTWVTTGHFIDTGSSSNYLKFGGLSASTGVIRIPNAQGMFARNAANSTDIPLLGTNSNDVVLLYGYRLALLAKGSDLTDANVTKNVSDGYIFELPTATLSTGRAFTAGITGAVTKHVMSVRRWDVTVNTYQVKNNAGTVLFTMPASTKYQVDIVYNTEITNDWSLAGHGGLS